MLPYFPPLDETSGSASSTTSEEVQRSERQETSNTGTTGSDSSSEEELKSLRTQKSQMKSMINAKQATIDELTAELNNRKAKEEALQLAYDQLLRESRTTSKSEGSSGETPAIPSEKFGDSPDIISRREVQEWFKTLNAQILTISGTCSSISAIQAWFKGPKQAREPLKESDADMIKNLRQIIGQRLLDALTELDYSKNQLAMLLSMQAIMNFFVSRVCEAYPFSPMRKVNDGKGIWFIYNDIHEHETQAVSSRWRAIGSKYSRTKSSTNELQLEMQTCTLQWLGRVLYVAGVSNDIIKLQQYCWNCASTGVKELWPAVIQFAEYIKEHVFSTDYNVIYAAPSSLENPRTNNTAQDDSSAAVVRPPVLCTCQLGLDRRTNMSKSGETMTEEIVKSEVIMKGIVIYEQEFEKLLKI